MYFQANSVDDKEKTLDAAFVKPRQGFLIQSSAKSDEKTRAISCEDRFLIFVKHFYFTIGISPPNAGGLTFTLENGEGSESVKYILAALAIPKSRFGSVL